MYETRRIIVPFRDKQRAEAIDKADVKSCRIAILCFVNMHFLRPELMLSAETN